MNIFCFKRSLAFEIRPGASQYFKLIYVATVLVVTGEPEI